MRDARISIPSIVRSQDRFNRHPVILIGKAFPLCPSDLLREKPTPVRGDLFF